MSISVVGPSPTNRSQRCHSEVIPVSDTGSSRPHRIVLFERLGVPVFGLALGQASQLSDSRQITASQRVLACCSASCHRSPARIPVCGSRSKKISSAKPGSRSISHSLTATADRLSRLE